MSQAVDMPNAMTVPVIYINFKKKATQTNYSLVSHPSIFYPCISRSLSVPCMSHPFIIITIRCKISQDVYAFQVNFPWLCDLSVPVATQLCGEHTGLAAFTALETIQTHKNH